MRQKTLLTLTSLSLVAVCVACPLAAQASSRWYAFDSLKVGSALLRVEASPQRQIRIVLRNGEQELISSDMESPMLLRWAESVEVGMALGSRRPFEFENTIALQSAAKGDSTGYAITIADSVGTTNTFFASPADARSLVVTLEHLSGRLTTAAEHNTDIAELASDAGVLRCEHLRDSVVSSVAPSAWPRATLADRPTRLRYPTAPADAAPGKQIVAAIVLLPIGSLDSTYFDVSGTDDANYKSHALEWMSRMKWLPAEVEGCPVVSKTSLTTVRMGIVRHQ